MMQSHVTAIFSTTMQRDVCTRSRLRKSGKEKDELRHAQRGLTHLEQRRGKQDRWMTCGFTSFLKVFQSYLDDGMG